MRIEELSVGSFGAVRQFSCKPDTVGTQPLCDQNGTDVPLAEFLTYVFYGKIPTRLLIPESTLGGAITLRTESGLSLRIERKTDINVFSVTTDTLSVTDLCRKLPLSFERTVGEELFGVDALLFEPFVTLGTKEPLPEHLCGISRTLLDANASDAQIADTVRRIDEASASLLRPNRKGGAIYELDKKLFELENEIQSSEKAVRRRNELQKELASAEEERKNLKCDLEKILELKSAYSTLSVIRDYDRLHAIEDDLDRERSSYEDFLSSHRFDGFMPTEEYCRELGEMQTKVTDTVRTYTEARAKLTLLESEEEDSRTLADLETVERKYDSFDAVKRAATTLFRRASHTVVFSCLALFAAAFFTVCMLLTSKTNADLSLSCLMLTLCCVASALVLLFSRRRFVGALLFLCREFRVKNRDDLLMRLRFLEAEHVRLKLLREKRKKAREDFENAKIACAEALDALDRTTAKWGRHIDPSQALSEFEKLLDEIRYFLKVKRDFCERIAEKERRVTMARKVLSSQSEIAVRARVSPVKRENLRQLEKENRLREIMQGIDFYNRQIDALDRSIEAMRAEHEEISSQIGDPPALYSARTALTDRKKRLLSVYNSYLLFKSALQNKKDAPEEHIKAVSVGAFSDCLALSPLLLREKTPFVIQNGALTAEELQAILHECRKENRQLFFDAPQESTKELLPKQ